MFRGEAVVLALSGWRSFRQADAWTGTASVALRRMQQRLSVAAECSATTRKRGTSQGSCGSRVEAAVGDFARSGAGAPGSVGGTAGAVGESFAGLYRAGDGRLSDCFTVIRRGHGLFCRSVIVAGQ